MKFLILLSFSLFINLLTFSIRANESVQSSIKRLTWNGIEVVFIEDNRFPTYDMLIYFADGALSDGKHPGETSHAFALSDSGTTKFTQKEILDQMEFLGTEFYPEVTHEYTTLQLSGLAKDFESAVKQTCHILRDSTYPTDVIKKELDKEKSGLLSLVSNPQGLSERIYREVSLAGSPYAYPVNGKLQDLDLFNSESLRSKTNYFLDKVKKRIYLTGPKALLNIEKVLIQDCKLKGSPDDFVRKVAYKKISQTKPKIVFVPVPDANQVQVKIGRFLNRDEIEDRNLGTISSDFLGGGFTSRLMREVRVKRGLTYSIGSYISSQKEYGRAGISTFTKNETINKLIEVVEGTLENIQKKGITEEELHRTKSGLTGSHPFKFELNMAFLGQLIYLDHIGHSYDELFQFNQKIEKYKTSEIKAKIQETFDLNKQTIFILGDKSLEKELVKLPKKYGKMTLLDYKKFI